MEQKLQKLLRYSLQFIHYIIVSIAEKREIMRFTSRQTWRSVKWNISVLKIVFCFIIRFMSWAIQILNDSETDLLNSLTRIYSVTKYLREHFETVFFKRGVSCYFSQFCFILLFASLKNIGSFHRELRYKQTRRCIGFYCTWNNVIHDLLESVLCCIKMWTSHPAIHCHYASHLKDLINEIF